MRASPSSTSTRTGSLSLQEFQALWAEITKPIAVRAFQFLDPDGDAAVAKAELDDRFGTVVSPFRPERRRHALARGPAASRPPARTANRAGSGPADDCGARAGGRIA